mgnify:CR=1 FL=1
MTADQNRKELFRLTWPIFCESALFSLIGSMDVIMLSRYSDNAVGAVGVANQVLFLFRVVTNIVTAGTGILCAQYIGAGKAAVNGLPCEKPDKAVTEGDKISLRGMGKIKLKTVGGQTKKGRISVVIDRYV